MNKHTDEFVEILKENIFHTYDITEVHFRNAVDYHAMNGEYTEIFGQFMDFTSMSLEQLKDCLIYGYLELIRGNKNERHQAVGRTLSSITTD